MNVSIFIKKHLLRNVILFYKISKNKHAVRKILVLFYLLMHLTMMKSSVPPAAINFFCVYGSSGRVLLSQKDNTTDFKVASELSCAKIIDASGSNNHYFALSSNGQVFCYGSNFDGVLVLGPDVYESDEFIEISALKQQKNISVSGSRSHSLFVTSEVNLFACGSNYEGKIFLSSGSCKDIIYTPVETSITKGASFSIAGDHISAVFIGKVPPNISNRQTVQKLKVSQNQMKQASPNIEQKSGGESIFSYQN